MQDENKQHQVDVGDIIDDPSSDTVDNTNAFSLTRNLHEQIEVMQKSIQDTNGKIAELNQKLKTKEQLDNLIEPCAKKSFIYIYCYSGGVFFIILLNGFGCFSNLIQGETLNVLVGSTAATVIGLVALVITGVFKGARQQ